MISRFLVSILLLPILFLSIYIQVENFIFLYIVVFIISIISNYELSRLFRKSYKHYSLFYEYLVYAFNFLLIYTFYIFKLYNLSIYIPILTPIFVILVALLLLIIKRSVLKQIILYISSFTYTGLFPLLIVILRYYNSGELLLYLFFMIIWINDASALFIGRKFGKIRGIVRYSPNKSLEGYIGSFFITLTISIIFKIIFSKTLCFTLMDIIIVSVVLITTGHLGDILESIIKRKANVKDSSRLFLGLGGMLDIFDSIFLSLPFYFLLLKIFCLRG